ncbi:MAG TPA: bifunctional glutamate N-acetyltransferase/amino-acid acetyltransferase ArgJ [Stellaceae bacterium]|nr:bifunctional glutamate N-acetyltransferase/amino-acid acetyltransferase ArgJ [Stellaceae bacterium]
MATPSPLAPASYPTLPPIAGVRLASAHCGIRYKERRDLMVALLDSGTTIAGVFTRSKTCGAPVEWCKAGIKRGKARAIVVNSGNSNTFTGKAGVEVVRRTVAAMAKIAKCETKDVFVASTGVIGEPPPADKIVNALPSTAASAAADSAAWRGAAEAILTTDTFPKLSTRTAVIDGVTVTLNGFCKGSGMIAPDMATMLAYLFTDAALPARVLQELLSAANERSFNSITVDGDTSTSDTVLLCATGKAAHKRVTRAADPRLKDFRRALDAVMIDLAQQIVKDGEGAGKFVTINVTGAVSGKAARAVGLAIGNSPLVKTALAAGDANWGRIVMAVGKSGERVDRDTLGISIGGVLITRDGGPVRDYDEAPVAEHMKGGEIVIDVDLGIGRGKATVWTCDLTHGYIDINGSYRS